MTDKNNKRDKKLEYNLSLRDDSPSIFNKERTQYRLTIRKIPRIDTTKQ